uniref:Solute carrier family 37 member 1 n=1 Tax=Rousettus aegyptiacus TaxID=9407 RepID=A0A7J8HW12_ROUAE|nr:solute carrier family 37 member 1 [Rousettus aegyptiacus]
MQVSTYLGSLSALLRARSIGTARPWTRTRSGSTARAKRPVTAPRTGPRTTRRTAAGPRLVRTTTSSCSGPWTTPSCARTPLACTSDPKDVACASTPPARPRSCENGVHRFRLQKPAAPAQGVIEFSLCLLFAKLVSYTFLFWLPLYITNVDHLDVRKAGELSTLFDVGGIFGGILAGVVSDRLGKRASTCGLMLLLAAPTLYIFSAVSRMGLEATVAMLLLSGALVSGPYALITTAVSADLGTHKSLKGNAHALATVTAIIDGTGSVGAALGPLLAGLLSPSGWTNVFYMLMFADACALLFLIRLIHKELSCSGLATTGDQVPFKEH